MMRCDSKRPLPMESAHVQSCVLDSVSAHVLTGEPPSGPTGNGLLTEGGDFLVTEGGDFIVTE